MIPPLTKATTRPSAQPAAVRAPAQIAGARDRLRSVGWSPKELCGYSYSKPRAQHISSPTSPFHPARRTRANLDRGPRGHGRPLYRTQAFVATYKNPFADAIQIQYSEGADCYVKVMEDDVWLALTFLPIILGCQVQVTTTPWSWTSLQIQLSGLLIVFDMMLEGILLIPNHGN